MSVLHAVAHRVYTARDRQVDRWRAEARERALVRRDRRCVEAWQGRSDLRISVGSSTEHVPGWISADLVRDPEGRCLQMDATQPWPFHDGAAEAIVLEHVIEHLDPDDLPGVLAEALRVLAPGGVLRLATPGLDGLAAAFLAADPAVLEAHRTHGYQARTHGDLFNNYAYLWGHRHLWDLESLRLRLQDAGFTNVEPATFGESRHPVLQGVDRHDPAPLGALVLIVDAVKPTPRSADDR
jgi:predicted SAM-dependent methyltransferase